MKTLSLMAGMLILIFASTISPTSINGRFVVLSSDSSKLAVKLQINTNTGTDDLGGATIVVAFNKDVLSFSSNPAENEFYKFHNFSGGSYNEATVTKPLSDKLWINIDLPSENNNKGTVISGLSGWTDVVTLNFDVKSPRDTARVRWLESNIFWQVYDADNSTVWSTGDFTDLVNAPVTVELLSFTAVLLDNSNIQLDWSTITYADNNGYEIERTSPLPSPYQGEGGEAGTSTSLSVTSWEKIGFVESKNILDTPVDYSFVDNSVNLSIPVYKYRIKSLNNDATFTILKEIEIEVETAPASFELAQNYPNPFNPSTKIRYTIPSVTLSGVEGSQQLVTLKIYDILGNEVATLVDEEKEAGSYEVEYSASDLASGVYVYRIQTTEFTETKKMILLR